MRAHAVALIVRKRAARFSPAALPAGTPPPCPPLGPPPAAPPPVAERARLRELPVRAAASGLGAGVMSPALRARERRTTHDSWTIGASGQAERTTLPCDGSPRGSGGADEEIGVGMAA